MSLAGCHISHSGAADVTTLVTISPEGHQQVEQVAESHPVIRISDSRHTEIASLAGAFEHPRELTVLAVSTQLEASHRSEFCRKVNVGFSLLPLVIRSYVDIFIDLLEDEEVKREPCILFIEVTPTMFCAQLGVVRMQHGQRVLYPLRSEGHTPTPTYRLMDLVKQMVDWAQSREYDLWRCVLFDVPSGMYDSITIQSTLSPSCPLIALTGVDLAKNAASYASKNIEMLRDMEPQYDAEYATTADLSFSVEENLPQVILAHGQMCPCIQEIVYQIKVPIQQSHITVEFLLGHQRSRPVDDKFTFAKVVLGGLPWDTDAEITVVASISEDDLHYVEVFKGRDRGKTDVRILLQIAEPFSGRAWDAVQALTADN